MKLDNKKTILVGFAFMSICAFWQLYDGIIPLILKVHYNLNDAATGFFMSLDNILALFLLPLFGHLSDKTHTKIGKRMPYIVIGTLFSSVFLALLPIIDKRNSFILFVAFLLLELLFMATYRSPAVALMPDVTPKKLRSKGNAIINLMGAVGGVTTLILIKFLVKKGQNPDYTLLFMAVAAFMFISVLILFLTIKENKERIEEEDDEEKTVIVNGKEKLAPPVFKSLIFLLLSVSLWYMGYNAIVSAFSRYAVVYWKMDVDGFTGPLMVGTIAAIISYIPIGIISGKMGRKKVILMGVVILIVTYTIAAMFKHYSPIMNVMFALVGFGWAAINVNSYPMVTEMSKGSNVGKYTGLYYTFSMSAQIVTPIASGALLEYVGYYTLFPYAAICLVLAFITMLFVRHGDII